MSTYQHKADFISRTRTILSKYEKIEHDYEKTLFLNCCLGLLIIPQQCAANDSNIYIRDIVNYNEWGINTSQIKVNTSAPKMPKNSAENIARHLRNSITHNNFNIIKCNVENIRNIHLEDFTKDRKTNKIKKSFDLELKFVDFKKFILKYANELEKIIRQNS